MAINHGSVVAGDGCDALTGEPLRRTAGGIPRFKPLPAADGLILTKSQAEAVYSAMCALNNVSANDGVQIGFVGADGGDMFRYTVTEDAAGGIEVIKGPIPARRVVEMHANQAAFATAYGLQQG